MNEDQDGIGSLVFKFVVCVSITEFDEIPRLNSCPKSIVFYDCFIIGKVSRLLFGCATSETQEN